MIIANPSLAMSTHPGLLLAPLTMSGVATILRTTMSQRVLSTIGTVAWATMSATVAVISDDWMRPVFTVSAIVSALAAARVWYLRVEVHPDELLLVNWTRKVHLPWSEMTRCAADNDGLLIRLTDGTEVHASAFHHGPRAFEFARRPALAAATRLEKIRRQRRRKQVHSD